MNELMTGYVKIRGNCTAQIVAPNLHLLKQLIDQKQTNQQQPKIHHLGQGLTSLLAYAREIHTF